MSLEPLLAFELDMEAPTVKAMSLEVTPDASHDTCVTEQGYAGAGDEVAVEIGLIDADWSPELSEVHLGGVPLIWTPDTEGHRAPGASW